MRNLHAFISIYSFSSTLTRASTHRYLGWGPQISIKDALSFPGSHHVDHPGQFQSDFTPVLSSLNSGHLTLDSLVQ